jgi:hypothetical protein
MTVALPLNEQETPVMASGADYATGTNANAVITYKGQSGVCHVISGFIFCYSLGTLSGGGWTLTDNNGVKYGGSAITQEGPGPIMFKPPKVLPPGVDMILTLLAGSASVVGELTVTDHWILPAGPNGPNGFLGAHAGQPIGLLLALTYAN